MRKASNRRSGIKAVSGTFGGGKLQALLQNIIYSKPRGVRMEVSTESILLHYTTGNVKQIFSTVQSPRNSKI